MEPFKDLKTRTPFSGVYIHKSCIYNIYTYIYIFNIYIYIYLFTCKYIYIYTCMLYMDFPGGSAGSLPAVWQSQVRSLGQEDSLEEEMATHTSILAWRIPWTEEPGGLQSMGSQRVRHH